MLKHRILTALILIPLVLALLFYAPGSLLCVAGLILLLGCSMEWITLIPLPSPWGTGKGMNKNLIGYFLFICGLVFSLLSSIYFFQQLIYLSFPFWILVCWALLYFPSTQPYWGKKILVALSGIFLLPLSGVALAYLYLQPQGSALILYLLLLVWATDTGAYIAGKWIGKHKLIPHVSPGKTIEGSLGGLLCALLVGLGGWIYFTPFSVSLWLTQALATIVLSMIGDLLISMLKRRVKCKDTSQILPGHGGLLDRLDSLIAAAPIFYFFIQSTT